MSKGSVLTTTKIICNSILFTDIIEDNQDPENWNSDEFDLSICFSNTSFYVIFKMYDFCW